MGRTLANLRLAQLKKEVVLRGKSRRVVTRTHQKQKEKEKVNILSHLSQGE